MLMNISSYILYYLACVLQPICLPVPETATILAGSIKLGSYIAFILGVIGTLTGITIMYFLVKLGNDKFLKKYKNKIASYRRYTRTHEVFITGLLFIIPVLPDEIVCIGAVLIGIKYGKLIVIAAISKTISISMVCFSDYNWLYIWSKPVLGYCY